MTDVNYEIADDSVVTGWDFSTTATKCLAFNMQGDTVAECRIPTDLWTESGVSELDIHQIERQVNALVQAIAQQLKDRNLLSKWIACGVSATHHTAGRLDGELRQVRRAICWNDRTLPEFHQIGLRRLGGQVVVRRLIHAPWAARYTLSHLVKDEKCLSPEDWRRTKWILPHGSLATGFLSNNFNAISVSSAASTGMMDLQSLQWRREMLHALEVEEYRRLAWEQLPKIMDWRRPVGRLTASLCQVAGLRNNLGPWVFPASDDQQAGLVAGGAVEPGHLAVILGASAVVNSASNQLPTSGNLDVMRLSWGPYLWMRCYNNGGQFLHSLFGADANWDLLEATARKSFDIDDETMVLPFKYPEPSLGVDSAECKWIPAEPEDSSIRYRVALEAIAFLVALGVLEHERAGQTLTRVTVSGGIAKSRLMCEILASVLNRPIELLESKEGPALGAAVVALAGLSSVNGRDAEEEGSLLVRDAASKLVKVRGSVLPNSHWSSVYRRKLKQFAQLLCQEDYF